ncbi:hypothetical protein KAR91_20405 [Candidatus Pacearchaeota archaeon]|nr:hypothetical protein [Candidatus Pacearchaeota archaeon]
MNRPGQILLKWGRALVRKQMLEISEAEQQAFYRRKKEEEEENERLQREE